ncbi:MAG: ABC transporter permease [Thiotrichales bacterium]|nr:ABC transporter permease [Thiotrichales bacterium]MBT3613715.1 ABC transporter permease [Thiotrichales bacterium]MBT3753099.1 ABC transporter permease [Thiotrichales bacterium]MBT3838279.1 ABC transporter permease [Thiotrichales bacterium]MBT4151690.1 ABC transporter permease [Thiotrichales bacterium]
MGAKPLFLWTDILIWFLVAVIFFGVSYTRRRPHLLQPWRRVSKSRLAMWSLAVLMVYVVIGLLDSIHFRYSLEESSVQKEVHYSVEAHTLLDLLLSDIRDSGEKSYSSPMAKNLFVQESIEREDGSVGRDYPLLQSAESHLLGTDKVGQDVLYQSLKSVRTGLVIGTLTTLIMLPFAVLLGIMAGYYRGWIDDMVQYTYTTLNSIPGVLLIAAAILMIQVYIDNNASLFETTEERADLRLLFLCIILGVTSWTGLCRLLRGETLKLREMDYISAAHAFGVSNLRIITRHILPNVMHVVLISVVLDFSGLVLAEAVLSYVGVGVDPTMYSWGNMINGARLEMAREPVVWWTLLASFLFMFTMVLAANLFSDVVREAFDPRLQSRGDK